MKKTTKQELVYQTLRKNIFNNSLPEGTVLTEERLCEQLGVSRTPVREAIRRLASEGFIDTIPGIGMSVSKIRLDDMLEIYEMREGLDRLAVKLYMSKIQPEGSVSLRDAFNRQVAAFEGEDHVLFMEVDMEFHSIISSGARNQRLRQSLDAIYGQINRAAVSVQGEHDLRVLALDLHRAICDAVDAGDLNAALDAMDTHNREIKQYHLKQLYHI